ncbi:unnamed protein product [Lymnaea stagnalis]|uniref:Integral membrane protein 2 n=1 Tax=Lymnaea stagnalis TaxID=6523 RepID=A0AAV2IIY3_LYMST
MTIYSPSQSEKKPEKGTPEPEVVTEPLTSFKDEEEGAYDVASKPLQVNYFQRKRRTFCIHLLLTIFILVILACGAIGAVVFYRHLNKKTIEQVYSGVCGNLYFDESYHNRLPEPMAFTNDEDFFEEKIESSDVEMYEQLITPSFDEVQSHLVWHDFSRNYTAIVDQHNQVCFIMKLNRSMIAPPRDVIDLIEKLLSGYYMPKAKVIRENYRPVQPPMVDLSPLGSRITSKCSSFKTFWLEKFVSGVVKRSLKEVVEDTFYYGWPTLHKDHPEVVKLIVHKITETEVTSAE